MNTDSLPRHLPFSVAAILLSLVISGCLPSSCNRTESRAVTSADSTSRSIATGMPVDTLALVWSSSGSDEWTLDYPRTLLFDNSGHLWVSDSGTDRVIRFGATEDSLEVFESDLFSYPYLAGASGDSIFVFSPGRQRVQQIVDHEITDMLVTPSPPKAGLLQYVHVTPKGSAFVKLIGDDFEPYVARLGRDGGEIWRHVLDRPLWTLAGNLRSWGDTLLSLRGYQPSVDLLRHDGTADSLRLTGFDSPMLARTRLFAAGSIDQPPLLSAAASSLKDELYVLNMRPGWLRVDVYDRGGRLKAVLTQPDPGFNKQFYPTDIAVRQVDGVIDVAISVVEPRPRVDFYRWHR
ncbi:MAG: hypothetical protein KJO98_08705 [Rhodothermia bacterium]|nr:hypothetical protein [Rhodothermia bacterium]